MNKPLKIVSIVVVSLVILGVLGTLVSNIVIKNKIENLIQNSLPETVEFNYVDIDVSVWNGRVVIVSPKIKNIGETTKLMNAQLEMGSLVVDGFGYWNFFIKDKINIQSVEFRQPQLVYYHNPLVDRSEYEYSKLEQLKGNITINRLNIQKGGLTVRNLETDSLIFKTENFTANVMDIQLDSNTVQRRVPFLFKDYNVHFDNLFYQLGDYENIRIKASKITNKESRFNDVKVYTKYSKNALSKRLEAERDHFDISINSILIKNQKFGYKQDSVFYLSSTEIIINEPKSNIYRNKLVNDDNSIKPLYSNLLRGLNFDLTLNKVLIKNAFINYSEKVKPEAVAGEIVFSNLNAEIANLSNTYTSNEKTTIDINTTFMKETLLEIEWYFDINDVNDHFIFKGNIGRLKAEQMNAFTEPNLNVRLLGEIHKTYFTIDGYNHSSSVDLKLNYDDFKLVVLQKGEVKKNKFLSTVVNIFVKKHSDEKQSNFRNGFAKVERNQTKSVFNFIWLNLRAGLRDALTGDGKGKG